MVSPPRCKMSPHGRSTTWGTAFLRSPTSTAAMRTLLRMNWRGRPERMIRTGEPWIADQLGHSLQTLFGTYAHVIEELRGQETTSAEEQIRAARQRSGGTDVAQKLPARSATGSVD